MSDIGKAYVQIIPEASGISGKMEQILGGEGEKGGAAFNKGFGSVIGGAGKVIAGAVAAGTAAVGGFAAASVSAGADFDAAMAQVGATMLKTTDEMEKEIGSVDTSFGTFNGNLLSIIWLLPVMIHSSQWRCSRTCSHLRQQAVLTLPELPT